MTEKFVFPEVEIGQILEKVTNPVKVELDKKYVQIGIRSHGKGLFDKEEVTGEELGNKRVFWIEPDCFVVNIVFAWEQAVGRTTKDDMGKIASHRFPMYRPKNGKADIDFISYLFKTKYGKELLTLASPGGAGRNKTLGQSEFAKLKIRVPSGVEQKKIAEILKTWDEAINTVERLIANVKIQKLKLFQKLLTGEKRLEGFDENWKENKFSEVIDIKIGGTPSRKNDDFWDFEKSTNNFWVSIRDLSDKFITKTKERISDKGIRASNVKLLPADTVIMSFKLSIGKKAILKMPAYTNEAICALIPKDESILNPRFIFHALDVINLEETVDQAIKGKTLNKEKIAKITIKYPSIIEQSAIIKILECQDDYLGALERKLNLVQSEKSALMQQLLTGKRRVKINKEDMAA